MLNWQQRIGRSEEMTEDTKLILEIIVPIIILLIMFCVMCWNKAITILIIVGFIITAAITLIAQIPAAKDKIGTSETQTYTTVEDKYIQTSGNEAIGKGSKILCTVYLKKDKILDVEFAEVHGRE